MGNKEKEKKILRYAQLVFREEQRKLSPEEQAERESLLAGLAMSREEALKRAENMVTGADGHDNE